MRRTILTALLLAAVAAPAGAQGAPAPAAASLERCVTAPDQADRLAAFVGEMSTIPGAQRMAMRFTLLAGQVDGRWARVDGPGLGTWIRSDPGTDRFKWRSTVQNLPAPGEYRQRIRFRWLDASGRILRSAARVTDVCTQPDPRPDLRVGDLTADLGPGAGLARYAVAVRNAGRGDAGSFDVVLRVGAVDRPPLTLSRLDAATDRTATFVAPRCASGDVVRVAVDPDDRVAEAREDDNVRSFPCPFA